ncbi:M23 family metallopeptidase [Actinopolymorpha pittospori]|uniref:Murein DD-endopeptidase MepM/ murein hydrolase activator NlpD n=1 Tax=Actinopolymorpha pittospori TaxID=648752 RepID=A0A927N474_9ACTN|nr:M23 family metallopeptidase [Actinopolymorpha pittospori]MBE1611422.1 murein DD-endopeptidase MepM/ murein hydrolase activator NlpD [Actinopolymorpha pittospori]
MSSFLSRLRALWGLRWRNIPLAAVSGVVAVGLVGGGVALAVGSPTESAASSVNSAVAEEAAAARTGNGNSSDSVTEKQRTAREQSAANRGGGHRNAPKPDKGKESSPPKDAAKNAVATKPKSWGLPLTEYHLTGRFGQSGNKWSSFHHGLDFAAPTGVPIHAVGSGRISAAGWAGAYGNRVEIRHPDGTVTLYGHMSKILRWSGSVHVGDVIGYVGATGNVTGPHVHLEVRPHGGGLDDAVNPFPWLVDKGLHP